MARKPKLEEDLSANRAQIRTDSYPISIGEILSVYEKGEIELHPQFQRFFRWSSQQKTRLIESILLGIPIPSIFVSQRGDGVLDVVDGFQRLSSILEFMGELKNENGTKRPPLVLGSAPYLKSLQGCTWDLGSRQDATSEIPADVKRLFRREKIDFKFLLRESPEKTKFELFQRINTGGTPLSDQETRNCILIMMNPDFFSWLEELGSYAEFQKVIALSERLLEERFDLELALRYLILKNSTEGDLQRIQDVSQYITDEMQVFFSVKDYKRKLREEGTLFLETFALLSKTMEDDAFRKWYGSEKRFKGPFLISAFEAIGVGLGKRLASGRQLQETDVKKVIKELWNEGSLADASGSGVSGRQRIPKTIKIGVSAFMKA
jgi:hypothetical protein